MKSSSNTKVDGILYRSGEELPNLGSFECTESTNVNGKSLRSYEGLSKDLDGLKSYLKTEFRNVLATGSTIICIDTQDFYKYVSSEDDWVLQ